MFKRMKLIAEMIWRRFRRLPSFVQLLVVVPVLCAIALTLFVGNMGLALLGTAIAINSWVAGWVGGLFVLILTKAGVIVAKDRSRRD